MLLLIKLWVSLSPSFSSPEVSGEIIKFDFFTKGSFFAVTTEAAQLEMALGLRANSSLLIKST
jgi:hypothetical protein